MHIAHWSRICQQVIRQISRAKNSVKRLRKNFFLQFSVLGVMTLKAENTFSPLYISVCVKSTWIDILYVDI